MTAPTAVYQWRALPPTDRDLARISARTQHLAETGVHPVLAVRQASAGWRETTRRVALLPVEADT